MNNTELSLPNAVFETLYYEVEEFLNCDICYDPV